MTEISIHALLAESDRQNPGKHYVAFRFLSTLSLRRATLNQIPPRRLHYHFYPRSPCGERLAGVNNIAYTDSISIHALLAESDWSNPRATVSTWKFLSTLSLRRATSGYVRYCIHARISIHALLAESDAVRVKIFWVLCPFLSTLSLRRATLGQFQRVLLVGYFYPRSPCGERRVDLLSCFGKIIFLSTLSLRRATAPRSRCYPMGGFLSTLSLRRATLCSMFCPFLLH